ncbi:uncharacterized protein Dvar_11440 [Desulfosarcina variabilis str. Montpellier]|uniref:hypothetical protein n=1 Tax=Desulfosarcina variabilis TaxID=2300 RepID=UPI003AFB2815
MTDEPITDYDDADAYLHLKDKDEFQKRVGLFVSGFDFYLSRGMNPKKALLVAGRDYAHEYYFDQCFGSRRWYMWRWRLVGWLDSRDIYLFDWLCYDDGDSPFKRLMAFARSLFVRRRRETAKEAR